MDGLPEHGGAWSARVYAFYGFAFLAVPAYFFVDLVLLGLVAWAAAWRVRGRRAWPGVPPRLRRGVRIAVEVSFGLVNPVLYLVVLAPWLERARGHRRSETSVRRLVREHAGSTHAAAARYDVDPFLIASIVDVTHRDQLSPFRDSLERLALSAWAVNLRAEIGVGPPDRVDEVGTDENPLLNRSLDVSVGLAQVKPRTALTASVLATGTVPEGLPRPVVDSYRDVEPVGEGWRLPAAARMSAVPPIPVPADREVVARAVLDAPSNLALCALILALYQHQWEAANPAWSLRRRPDILATLYQIGFARSKPHAAPRSHAFGRRVREVLERPWLADLVAPSPSTATSAR